MIYASFLHRLGRDNPQTVPISVKNWGKMAVYSHTILADIGMKNRSETDSMAGFVRPWTTSGARVYDQIIPLPARSISKTSKKADRLTREERAAKFYNYVQSKWIPSKLDRSWKQMWEVRRYFARIGDINKLSGLVDQTAIQANWACRGGSWCKPVLNKASERSHAIQIRSPP